MKKIADLINKLNITNNKQKEYCDEDRLRLLGIDDSMAEKIRDMKFIRTDNDEGEYGETYYAVISIDKLVGINGRVEVDSWLALLFKLHKKRNFDLFGSRDNFKSYVNNLNKACDDLPHVLDVGGEYVVNGNGKHRLTIAKCIGINQFPVIVTTLNNL